MDDDDDDDTSMSDGKGMLYQTLAVTRATRFLKAKTLLSYGEIRSFIFDDS